MPESSLSSFLPGYRQENGICLIAGPCSAESEAQLLTIASALQKLPVAIFRAGVWKPRTRPGAFQGAGEIALAWLQTVKRETGLPVAVEVATPAHAEAADRAGIDLFWIGARTVVNPFAMQELASALGGCRQPVLLKNPVTPDLGLWLGATERLLNAGVTRLGALLRGFVPASQGRWRHDPGWEIARQYRRHFPALPMLCDPSHIAGQTALIPALCQQALDDGFDGLMLEVHHQPETALSDAGQQLTPAQFETLVQALRGRTAGAITDPAQRRLDTLRHEIDAIDSCLVERLAARLDVVRQIGELKMRLGVPAAQPQRWQVLLDKIRLQAAEQGLDPDFVTDLYNRIHQEALRQQRPTLHQPEDSSCQLPP